MKVALPFLQLVARLSAVAALLAIPRDPKLAAVIALVSMAVGLARTFVRGEALGDAIEASWRSIVGGIRARDVRSLQSMREDEESVAVLSDAAREVALLRSTSIPDLISEALTLVVLGALVASRIPFEWIALAALLAAPLALIVRASQRRQFAAQQRGYLAHAALTRDLRALIEASPELRAQDREATFSASMLELGSRMAREERSALRFSSAIGAAPIALAVIALWLPTDLGRALIAKTGLIDIGVVGGATLATCFGLVRSIEAVRRGAPYQKAFARIASDPVRRARDASTPDENELGEIAFESVSVIHPGADHATPHALTLQFDAGGLALLGDNGSGKSTAIAVLLGLVSPTEGRVVIGGREVDHERSAALSRQVSYLPQTPFVSPGETLSWHADLIGVSHEALLVWFERLGLTRSLRGRGGAADSLLDLKLGSLSGGERQRFFLARALARPAKLLVLDEPEASLDQEAREQLSEVLVEVARDRRVIVIAHDVAFLPKEFRRVTCSSASLAPTTRGD